MSTQLSQFLHDVSVMTVVVVVVCAKLGGVSALTAMRATVIRSRPPKILGVIFNCTLSSETFSTYLGRRRRGDYA